MEIFLKLRINVISLCNGSVHSGETSQWFFLSFHLARCKTNSVSNDLYLRLFMCC